MHDGQQYTNTAATLNVGASATLDFGFGDPDYSGGTTANAMVAVPGTCTIAGDATVRVSVAGGPKSGTYLLVRAGTLNCTPRSLELEVVDFPPTMSAVLLKDGNDLLIRIIFVGTVMTIF